MPKTRLVFVTEWYQKAKNSQVRGDGKKPKGRKSALTEKCLKPADQRSQKNGPNSQVRGKRKMLKSRRSPVTKKYQKVAGLWSRKNAKN